jgi:hypothetical protein
MEERHEWLRAEEESLRKHGWFLNECAGPCAGTYRAHRDPEWFTPWCSTRCMERHAARW